MQPDQPKPPVQFDDQIPPDLLAYIKQTFDLEAYMAELREAEAGPLYKFEDFIDELERRAGVK